MASPLSLRTVLASGPCKCLVMLLLTSFFSHSLGCMLSSRNYTTTCGSRQCLNGVCTSVLRPNAVCRCDSGWVGGECDMCCDLMCDVGTCQIGTDGNPYCDPPSIRTESGIPNTTLPHEYPCNTTRKEVFEPCNYSRNTCYHGNCNRTVLTDAKLDIRGLMPWPVDECHCLPRWQGLECDLCCDLACANGDCFHDGRSHRKWCNCYNNYTGEFCETMVRPGE